MIDPALLEVKGDVGELKATSKLTLAAVVRIEESVKSLEQFKWRALGMTTAVMTIVTVGFELLRFMKGI